MSHSAPWHGDGSSSNEQAAPRPSVDGRSRAPAHDAFLSHNSLDKPTVEALARRLQAAGVHVWLDKWELGPGAVWQELQQSAIRSASATVVCLGKHDLGRWQATEVHAAIDRAHRDARLRIYPVLLPSAPADDGPLREQYPFLAQYQWVDLRREWDPGVGALAAEIRQHRPPRPHPALHMPPGFRPYRGLAPFREEDASWMFGREADVGRLVGRLQEGIRMTMLVGPSGSGKSSLLLGGLVPAVRTGAVDGSSWRVIVMRPGGAPCNALATALVQLESSPELAKRMDDKENVRRRLIDSPTALADAVSVLTPEARQSPCLLVVDQFEEVFAAGHERGANGDGSGVVGEANAFVANLVAATDAPGALYVAASMRADFTGECLATPALAVRFEASVQVVLPRMADVELRQVICGPAQRLGVTIDAAVVDALVTAVGAEPGRLPLLEHTLDQLWDRRDADGCIGYGAYVDIGGLRGALTRAADKALAKLEPAERQAARRVLLRLVRLGEGTGDTRRRAWRGEFRDDPAAERVLEALARDRLVIAHRDTVEIAHETLIREWSQLRRWLVEDRDAQRVQEDLAIAAIDYQHRGGRTEDLWRGARLHQARELQRSGRLRPSPSEQQFLNRSMRQRRLVHAAAFVLACLLAAAVVDRTVATQRATRSAQLAQENARRASRSARRAERNADEVSRSRASLLLELGRAEWLANHPMKAAVYLSQAYKLDTTRPDVRGLLGLVMQSVDALQLSLDAHRGVVNTVAFSPDGTRMVTGGSDGMARLWNAITGQEVATIDARTASVLAAALSPDGKRLITAGRDDVARIWNASTGEAVGVLKGHRGEVRTGVYSRDGDYIATASWDGTAKIWEADTLRPVVTLEGSGEEVDFVAFAPRGGRLVSGSRSGVALWDAPTGKRIAALGGQANRLRAAAFSPDGRRVATMGRETGASV
ncbi:MAG: TIR domain-containing protein [Myxococcales bacterium]|nr:TIR domain-containing protein [Myxococcales bacterium]